MTEETDRIERALAAMENFIKVTGIDPPKQTIELMERWRRELNRPIEAPNPLAARRENDLDTLRREDGGRIEDRKPAEKKPKMPERLKR